MIPVGIGSRWKAKNLRASQPLNAALNLAYAVLQSQVQIEAVAAGYDPTLGVMHHGRRGAPALVFDMMEPKRPKMDAAVLAFALSETFSGTDFVIRLDGVVRLAPQLARRVCQLISMRFGIGGQTKRFGLALPFAERSDCSIVGPLGRDQSAS